METTALNPETDTDEEFILTRLVIATDDRIPWAERRRACHEITARRQAFLDWAQQKESAAFAAVGGCPCCPHPRPIPGGSCAMDYFRVGGILSGAWDGSEGWELKPSDERLAGLYAATLDADAAARFALAMTGESRITAEDYIAILRTVDAAMDAGGWGKYFFRADAPHN